MTLLVGLLVPSPVVNPERRKIDLEKGVVIASDSRITAGTSAYRDDGRKVGQIGPMAIAGFAGYANVAGPALQATANQPGPLAQVTLQVELARARGRLPSGHAGRDGRTLVFVGTRPSPGHFQLWSLDSENDFNPGLVRGLAVAGSGATETFNARLADEILFQVAQRAPSERRLANLRRAHEVAKEQLAEPGMIKELQRQIDQHGFVKVIQVAGIVGSAVSESIQEDGVETVGGLEQMLMLTDATGSAHLKGWVSSNGGASWNPTTISASDLAPPDSTRGFRRRP